MKLTVCFQQTQLQNRTVYVSNSGQTYKQSGAIQVRIYMAGISVRCRKPWSVSRTWQQLWNGFHEKCAHVRHSVHNKRTASKIDTNARPLHFQDFLWNPEFEQNRDNEKKGTHVNVNCGTKGGGWELSNSPGHLNLLGGGSSNHWTGCWVVSNTRLDVLRNWKISCPHRDSSRWNHGS